MNDYQHVLCVVDLSDENYLLSKRAADLAGRYSATLHLLHVVEQLPSEVSSNIVLPDQQNIEDYLVENAIKVLDKLKGELEFPGANSSVVSTSIWLLLAGTGDMVLHVCLDQLPAQCCIMHSVMYLQCIWASESITNLLIVM